MPPGRAQGGCYYGRMIQHLRSGQLASYLSAVGAQNHLVELKSGSQECALWWNAQRANPGHYFACAFCDCEMVLSRSRTGRYKASRRKFTQHDGNCPFKTRQTPPPMLTVEGVHAFANNSDAALQTYLTRFALSLDRVCQKMWRKTLSPTGQARSGSRCAKHSLLGFLKLLTEFARLNVWFSNRSYATEFWELMPHLARTIAFIDRTATLSLLRMKLVFPETGQFSDSLHAAVAAPSNLKTLSDRAIVIGRLFCIEISDMIELTLTGMASSRLRIPKMMWDSLCCSFGKPELPLPSQDHTAETLLVAVVTLQEAHIEVEQAAWARIDRHGIASESSYEHDAILDLIKGGFSFIKPQLLPLKVGRHAMLVDFLMLTKPMLVVEIDPHGSARTKRRKILRTARFKEAKQPHVSFDPTTSTNLSEAIRAAIAAGGTS